MAEKKTKTGASSKAAGAKVSAKAASTKTKQVMKGSGAKATPKSGRKKTTFALRAPEATKVFVAGCFNDWNPAVNPLKRAEEGMWTCTLFLEPGEHEYRFVVDDVWWDDPLNFTRRQTEYGCENCVLVI